MTEKEKWNVDRYVYERYILFAESSAYIIAAIVKYNSYFGVSIDIAKYHKLLKKQKNQTNISLSYLIRNLINKHPEIRDALICSNPMMEWAPCKLQRDGKNPLVLKIIAELLWNDAPESIIKNLIPHIYHLRIKRERYCRWITSCNRNNFKKTGRGEYYNIAKRHYDEKKPIWSRNFEEIVNSIFERKGFISVEELNALGIIPFTSRTYIKDLCDLTSKSYEIKQFLKINDLLCVVDYMCREAYDKPESIHMIVIQSDEEKICINPYSILLSSIISKSDKIKWLEEQVKFLKKSGNKSYLYQDEALKSFYHLSIKQNIKGIAAFSIGKINSPTDIRIDIVMSTISRFLGIKLK